MEIFCLIKAWYYTFVCFFAPLTLYTNASKIHYNPIH